MLDHFCGNECWSVFLFGGECIQDVCDGSCTLGVELVMCLTARLICVLLELTSNSNNDAVSRNVGTGCGDCCLGWNECTHPSSNPSNERGGDFGGNAVTRTVAPMAEQKGSTT